MVRCVIMGREIRSHCLESGAQLAMIVVVSRKHMMICNISSGKQQVGFVVVNIFFIVVSCSNWKSDIDSICYCVTRFGNQTLARISNNPSQYLAKHLDFTESHV